MVAKPVVVLEKMKKLLVLYFTKWWLPAAMYFCLFGGYTITLQWWPDAFTVDVLLCIAGLAFIGLIAATIRYLVEKKWTDAVANIFLVLGSAYATLYVISSLLIPVMFGPDKDGFADNLTIPEGIEISYPVTDSDDSTNLNTAGGTDEQQDSIRRALAVPGGDDSEFTPSMPALCKAATDHAERFRDYLEASPDWHVFAEGGNDFAVRRWSYKGEPRDTLSGYISEFGVDSSFQTRCLLSLDRKQWSRYAVQHVSQGTVPVKPKIERGNNLYESRVVIECDSVWVEIFEQSAKPERRITKATITALEKEFSDFAQNPIATLVSAQAKSRDLAIHLAGKDGTPFQLLEGMQPGIYGVLYSLNPGEPGWVYLKVFEVTKGTPLSADRVAASSKTRMTWSTVPAEKFGAKAGFTIYEGDWGKPYAARFEVWFKPDSGEDDRKLAERVFIVEGWQR